ncbi:MAG TPA: aminotransferase class I/II-fold pyridoxal phosphate-dependent enzyme [Thermoanaerobaculia bacterium]
MPDDGPVHFSGDGLSLSPPEYARLLVKLAAEDGHRDNYMAGGVVETLEKRFAQVLGKERAVFVPTGTLANHLAIRNLAPAKTRVLVQAESHIYNDSLDCVQVLSHLNLVPLAPGQATFPLGQVEEACKRAMERPYPIRVGAMSIECPVRRKDGEAFDHEEMKRIARFARENDIRLHLDGARLFVASAYTGVAPAEYAALFDTVYVSLYKTFNAAAGAILAGPAELIEQVARDRKVFGSGLAQAWPYAAVALHYLEGFPERFQKAVEASKALFALLDEHPRLRVEPLPRGTNIYKLHVKDADPAKYREALATRGIRVPRPNPDEPFQGLRLVVNESLNRKSAPELAKVFIESLP